MAALVVQNGIQASRLQTAAAAAVPVATLYIQRSQYSSNVDTVKPIKKPSLSSMKRGTGGRSSFSGIVATVFGASGYLGNHVCHRLGKIGSQVIIPYRGDHYDLVRLKLVGDLGQVLFVPFHLRNDESIYNAVKYSNVVINLIGRDWETKNFTFNAVNVEGARRIAQICKEAGVEKYIHISDLNAVEKPEGHVLKGGSKHLATKFIGEHEVRRAFPDATIFKPAFIAGPVDKFLRSFAHNVRTSFVLSGIPLWKKGEETIKQPVYVHDVAEAIIHAIRDKDAVGKTYQAVGPKRYRLSDLVDWFVAEMRGDIRGNIYKRKDISYDFFFKLQVSINQQIFPGFPAGNVHWEQIERESVTDVVKPNLPTLEDLGVALTPMEHYVPWCLRPYRGLLYYDAELNEFSQPTPPQPV